MMRWSNSPANYFVFAVGRFGCGGLVDGNVAPLQCLEASSPCNSMEAVGAVALRSSAGGHAGGVRAGIQGCLPFHWLLVLASIPIALFGAGP
jgi:hypothetical protein